MRFILFVEGHTEAKAVPDFIKRWLDPQLNQRVGIKPVRFDGWAELIADAAKKAHLYLNGPQSDEIIGVVGLLDLYGPTIYPNHATTANERYDWLKSDMEHRVNHPRFRQFFAVHETEGWLLSNPDLFPHMVKSALVSEVRQPEAVNFHEPSAKLLERVYEERIKRSYKKVTHGRDLVAHLDPVDAYAKCPKLKELLDEMLTMARGAGL